MDLDINAGMIGFLMNTKSDYGIMDAADNLQHLDLSWESIMVHGADDLHIVHSPGLLGAGAPNSKKIRDVISFVRAFYPWIVVDLGQLTELSRALMPIINELLLITTAVIPALYGTKRTLTGLRTTGFDPAQIRLIVNQLSSEQQFSTNTLDRIFETPIYATLPHAPEELHLSCTKRTLPPATGVFGSKIASLVRKIAGLPEEPSRRGFARFLRPREKTIPEAGAAQLTSGVSL